MSGTQKYFLFTTLGLLLFSGASVLLVHAQSPAMGPAECSAAGITDQGKCREYLMQKYMPEQCKSAGITSEEDCTLYLTKMNMPAECVSEGILDRVGCENFIFKKLAPKPCIENGLTDPAACDAYISTLVLPNECVEEGITENHDACLGFLTEKYGSEEKIPPTSFPPPCVSAGAKTFNQCETVMTEKFAPEECRLLGKSDPNSCRVYLTNKYLPKECVKAGQTTKEGCDAVMFKLFAPKECADEGITNETQCRKFMTKLLAPRIVCEGLGKDACGQRIENNHIGKIVAARDRYEKIRIYSEDKQLSVAKLQGDQEELGDLVPLVNKEARVIALNAEEKILLNKDDNVVHTAPIVLMLDSDGDGLGDDMEARLGSDPLDPDTDGNGVNDLAETLSGEDPIKTGSLTEKLYPIDMAILKGEILGHPRTSGAVDDRLTVLKAETVPEEVSRGTRFSGKGEPNSAVTLYVYSELPVVVTVTTNQYGDWVYEIAEPLKNGDHEVYVVVSDRSGKVVRKSNPLSFFVAEARAAVIGDEDVPPAEKIAAPSLWGTKQYLIGLVAFLIFAIVGFIAYAGHLYGRAERENSERRH